jgi:carbamoyltransferase
VANGRLLREGPFKDIWIQPAAGDAGGAVGAALSVWYEYLDKPRATNGADTMSGGYLGPRYTDSNITEYLDSVDARYVRLDDEVLFARLAELLDQEKVIGWFQGRMEFGPRALGGRSIVGDPRSRAMQSLMNLKIKYRESFRPFAPSVLAERVSDYFEIDRASPYMLLVADVNKALQHEMTEAQKELFGIEQLNIPRSTLPAITHVDYSARIQTVHKETNPRYHALLKAFEVRTGCPVLVNTSFNVRGEPIVCTPEDAYRCFMRTEMDYLVLENYLLAKVEQPEWAKDDSWKDEFELD